MPPGLVGNYRVYKDLDEFIVVQAHSATEALQLSKLPEARRIQRLSLDSSRVFAPDALSIDAPAEAKAPAAGESPEKTVSPATETKDDEAAPLSGEEVDQLLKN